MATFRYSARVLERYPSVVGGVLFASHLHNGPSPSALHDSYATEQQATLARIGENPLRQIPSLAAWRTVFRGFGVDPTQYRSAAEALLRRLTKKGDIPSVNTLVDVGSLVSIRYALPVALFDTRALAGPLAVCFAEGTEHYTTLGDAQMEHPETGEVVFNDESGTAHARRWCFRQSERSAVHDDTTEALVTVEAHHAGARNDIEAALGDLLTLLRTYVGGSFESGVVDAAHPVFESATTSAGASQGR